MKKLLFLISIVMIVSLMIAACGGQQPTATPEIVKETVMVTQEVVVTKEVEVMVTPTPEPYAEIPFQADWAGSPHAKADAEAFVHWDKADPAEVPVTCAKCHSTPGYLDFLGADGSEAGKVDKAAPIGTVIRCVACHNNVTPTKTSVVFPSGVEVAGLGPEARCMECHQGRESKVSVDAAIEKAGLTKDVDKVSADLGFTNIHYLAAGATQMGGIAMGGYQYEGKAYDAKFAHVAQFNTCNGCHNQHTLELRLDSCKTCHTDVASKEDLRKIRMAGSQMDYDGDGNVQEGIYDEIAGLRDTLNQAMQAYAKEVSKVAIVYSADTYPYFFVDTNGNGALDKEEADAKNKYTGWTARLAKAAYNYQVSIKDPGAFAHGGKYIIELLYDSIDDLNQALTSKVDLSKAHRIDAGHFAGSEEAFRHWDADGAVPATCSRCHSAEGLPLYVKDNASITQNPSNGMLCTTCHESITGDAPRHEVKQVQFPSGLVITSTQAAPNTLLCMTCHQGRESTVSVNKLIGDLKPDEGSEKLRFLNVHYFAAGATRYGTQAKGAYEYDGQKYNGYFAHKESVSGCTDCHDNHKLEVKADKCGNCHDGIKSAEDLKNIRVSEVDYDGDGDKTEGMVGEISTMYEALYKAMQVYAADKVGKPIAYNPQSYPYYFNDTNNNGEVDQDEANAKNGYASWTPRLLRAAYNYQYVTKDPGAFAHNGKYILQVLYDSLKDIGGNVQGITRPEVEAKP
jgi:hypothetical protein